MVLCVEHCFPVFDILKICKLRDVCSQLIGTQVINILVGYLFRPQVM